MRSPTPAQIGFIPRLFPDNWRPASQEIEFARAQGFECLQFHVRWGALGEKDLGGTFTEIANALQAAKLTAAMEILAFIDASGRTNTGATPLDVLKANLPAITTLPCARVHWHIASPRKMSATTGQELEKSLRPQFTQGLALAQEHGFILGFEHNDPEFPMFSTPESCAALLEDVPGLKFVWDFNHTKPEHLAGYQALIPHVSLVHVSDTPLPEVNHHLPLGLGTVDYTSYCTALLDGGFDGPLILEIGGQSKSGGFGQDTDQALIDSRQRLQTAIGAS
jgi:sugar phosphate isomerase/epimerase